MKKDKIGYNYIKMGNRHSTNNHVVTEIQDVSKYGYYEYKFSPTNRIFRLFYKNPKFGEIRPKLIENAVVSVQSVHWDEDSESSSYHEIKDVKPAKPISLTVSVLSVIPTTTFEGYYKVISAPRNEYPDINLYIKTDQLSDSKSLNCKTIFVTAKFLSPADHYQITSYEIIPRNLQSKTLREKFKVIDIIASYKQDGYLEVIPDRSIMNSNSLYVTIFILEDSAVDQMLKQLQDRQIVADLELFVLPNRYKITKWYYMEQ